MDNSTALSCAESARSAGSGESDADSSGSVPFGIALGLVASVGINLGQNLQNTAENHNVRLWSLGFALFVFSSVANFVSFAFAPASVLAPLEGAQFVTNFVYGLATRNNVFFQDGKWRREAVLRAAFGTLLVCVGIILPIISVSSEVAEFDTHDLWCFWRATEWWVYFVTTSVLALVCWVLDQVFRNKESNDNNKNNRFLMLLFSVSSAVLGAFAVVQAKAISELVEPIFTRGEWEVLSTWIFWQCLIFILIGLGFWLKKLSVAPSLYEVLAILPLMQGCYIIFSSIGGGIFFQEFTTFNDIQMLLFCIGLMLIVTGLWFVIPQYDASTQVDTKIGGCLLPVCICVNRPLECTAERGVRTSLVALNL
jgi:hypothetical protein